MKIEIEIADKITPEIKAAVEGMKAGNHVDKLNAICYWLIKQLHETNAEIMTIKQEGVHNLHGTLGNYEIRVRRIAHHAKS